MTIQSDKWIRNMAKSHEMINPFEENQIRDNKISYGLSSYGYDARVSNEFKIFTNVNSEVVDPKNFKQSNFISKKVSELRNAMQQIANSGIGPTKQFPSMGCSIKWFN